MRKKIIFIMTILMTMRIVSYGQETSSTNGQVIDHLGKPVYGAVVTSVNAPGLISHTDRDGSFEINVLESDQLRITTSDGSYMIVDVEKSPMTITMGLSSRAVNIGYEKTQNIKESTSSVSIAYGDELNKRSARDIGSSLYGSVLGLTALNGAGNYYDFSNAFYVRGLQTLTSSGNSPLILVDGIERDLKYVSPDEVESVTVLKDAAAVAIYGYKGANGAINIVTKRGKYNSREIKFSYDFAYNTMSRKPEFVDAYTYANAMNEALVNDNRSPRYSSLELDAFQSGEYPNLYPNVNWIDETFKDAAYTQTYNISFRGGGSSFRYFTLLNLKNDNGYIKSPNQNEGYSTQNKYSKANLRSNMDIDLTPTTKLTLNLLGTLQEMSRPGQSAQLWSDMIYTVPAAAFPIKTDDGLWGGSSTWNGTLNPVAQSRASGYSKSHERSLFADMTLQQKLDVFVPGLSGSFKLAYDNIATYWEDHYKQFSYGSNSVTEWIGNKPNLDNLGKFTGGTDTGLATGSDLISWARVFNTAGALNYDRNYDDHSIYSQLKWDFEYRNRNGVDNTWYRHNVSLYNHYGYRDRYYLDLTLVASAANKLAPSSRWGFSPTLSGAWVASQEDFLSSSDFIDFLKLRASFGVINRDNIPEESYWDQRYITGSHYLFDTGYSSDGLSPWKFGRFPTLNPTHEKAIKYNLGVDATLFKGLNITLDGYFQNRKDIWVESSGKYSSVLGFDPPYENGGVVHSWGFESGVDYFKKMGDFSFNLGANFTLNKNKIKEQYEELRLYENLVTTGKPVGQIYGLVAEGFFKDQADIDSSVPHLFSEVRPGDIKYKDVNNDGFVDANDVTAIGYNTLTPEIYYSFKLGAEWKGLGFDALFQGAGNYSAMLNTKSVYWPLINDTNISQHYYDNRWTPDNQSAKYPALSSQSNNNNFRGNTVWLEDRSFLKLRHVELYYNFSDVFEHNASFIDNAKLYLRGVDLLCLDNIKIVDPESYGATNPLNKSVIIGLSLTF